MNGPPVPPARLMPIDPRGPVPPPHDPRVGPGPAPPALLQPGSAQFQQNFINNQLLPPPIPVPGGTLPPIPPGQSIIPPATTTTTATTSSASTAPTTAAATTTPTTTTAATTDTTTIVPATTPPPPVVPPTTTLLPPIPSDEDDSDDDDTFTQHPSHLPWVNEGRGLLDEAYSIIAEIFHNLSTSAQKKTSDLTPTPHDLFQRLLQIQVQLQNRIVPHLKHHMSQSLRKIHLINTLQVETQQVLDQVTKLSLLEETLTTSLQVHPYTSPTRVQDIFKGIITTSGYNAQNIQLQHLTPPQSEPPADGVYMPMLKLENVLLLARQLGLQQRKVARGEMGIEIQAQYTPHIDTYRFGRLGQSIDNLAKSADEAIPDP